MMSLVPHLARPARLLAALKILGRVMRATMIGNKPAGANWRTPRRPIEFFTKTWFCRFLPLHYDQQKPVRLIDGAVTIALIVHMDGVVTAAERYSL